jgi:hypothetical protein
MEWGARRLTSGFDGGSPDISEPIAGDRLAVLVGEQQASRTRLNALQVPRQRHPDHIRQRNRTGALRRLRQVEARLGTGERDQLVSDGHLTTGKVQSSKVTPSASPGRRPAAAPSQARPR